jgi:hypothetical protein
MSRRRRSRTSAEVAASALVLLAAGCSSGTAAQLPPGRPHVTITMRDYRFEHGFMPKGQVVFDVKNLGAARHRLSLIQLPPELPPIEQQVQGSERAAVTTQAAVADLGPGGIGTVATELVPGRYALVCFNVDADGSSHARKGMATEFRIE